MSLRRLLLLLVIGLAAAPGTAPAPALAQTSSETVGIRIVDVPTSRADDPRAHQYIVDHVAPGTTVTRRVEVSNNTTETQLVQLYPAAAGIRDGNFQFADGRAANDLTGWTTIVPTAVSPPAGRKSPAEVTITVPAGASPGERYGVVWAELPRSAPQGGGVATVNRVGIRIYLSVGPGGEPASDFVIESLTARRNQDRTPIVSAQVRNTGGRALDLNGDLQLAQGPGGLNAGPFPARLGTTLAVGRTEPVDVPLSRQIPDGPWAVTITLRSGLVERSASAQILFPAEAGTATGPVQATLTTERGRRLRSLAIVVGLVGLLAVLLVVLGRRRRHRQ